MSNEKVDMNIDTDFIIVNFPTSYVCTQQIVHNLGNVQIVPVCKLYCLKQTKHVKITNNLLMRNA